MTSDRHLKAIERTDAALKGMEDQAIARLSSSLEASYRKLEKQLLASYDNYTSESLPSLLANQRALLLADELKALLPLVNPTLGKQIQADFERLLTSASAEGVTLASELMRLTAGDSFVAVNTVVPVQAVAIASEGAYKRLLKHGNEFAEKSTAIITQGLIQGKGSAVVARGLREQLGVTKSRGEAIARTESMTAHNTAATQHYKANGVGHWQSIATGDSRVCPTCSARNMQAYEIGKASVPWHVRCLTGDTLLVAPGVKTGTSREYRGEVVCIETASGKTLTATPNHPVLTNKGWVSIGLLQEGDNIFSCVDSRQIAAARPDDYHRPALIEEIVRSLHESNGVLSASVKVAPEYFHNDGKGSEVCVVSSYGLLGDNFTAKLYEQLMEADFNRRQMGHRSLLADRHPAFSLPVDGSTPTCVVCSANLSSSLDFSHLAPLKSLRLGLRSQRNSTIRQNNAYSSSRQSSYLRNLISRQFFDGVQADDGIPNISVPLPKSLSGFGRLQDSVLAQSSLNTSLFERSSEDIGAEPESLSSILSRFPGEVFADRIVQSSRKDFVGHVYNVETNTGWYFANDILTHNCRCYAMPWSPEWEALGLTDNDWASKFVETVDAELAATGKKPDPGLAGFEKANGGAAGKPVWSVQKGYLDKGIKPG